MAEETKSESHIENGVYYVLRTGQYAGNPVGTVKCKDGIIYNYRVTNKYRDESVGTYDADSGNYKFTQWCLNDGGGYNGVYPSGNIDTLTLLMSGSCTHDGKPFSFVYQLEFCEYQWLDFLYGEMSSSAAALFEKEQKFQKQIEIYSKTIKGTQKPVAEY
eukprot:171855_1